MSNKKEYFFHNKNGDIMKKYFFLIALVIIYFVIIGNKSKPVFLNTDSYKIIDKIHIKFRSGINSKRLIDIMNRYDLEYYVNNMNVYNKDYEAKCNKIDNCINDIYSLFDDRFYDKYIVNGFRINSIDIITDRYEFTNLLNSENIIFDYY